MAPTRSARRSANTAVFIVLDLAAYRFPRRTGPCRGPCPPCLRRCTRPPRKRTKRSPPRLHPMSESSRRSSPIYEPAAAVPDRRQWPKEANRTGNAGQSLEARFKSWIETKMSAAADLYLCSSPTEALSAGFAECIFAASNKTPVVLVIDSLELAGQAVEVVAAGVPAAPGQQRQQRRRRLLRFSPLRARLQEPVRGTAGLSALAGGDSPLTQRHRRSRRRAIDLLHAGPDRPDRADCGRPAARGTGAASISQNRTCRSPTSCRTSRPSRPTRHRSRRWSTGSLTNAINPFLTGSFRLRCSTASIKASFRSCGECRLPKCKLTFGDSRQVLVSHAGRTAA